MREAATESPHLEGGEKDQARRHAPLRALVIHEIIRAEGEAELEREIPAMIWSGLAAGLSMGFSFAVQALLANAFDEAVGREAIASLGYTVGFLIVVLGRQQLFTESTLTAVLPVLTRRDGRTLAATLRLWSVVLAANLVGTWIFAAALAFGHPLPPEADPSLAKLAADSVAQPFGATLLRAVFAGWLIALMVWLLPSSRSARMFIIIALAWVVAFAKLSHIIAGSTEAAYGVLTRAASLGDYFGRFLLPTLIGNIIGGVALVAMLNHAPIASEMEAEEPDEIEPR
jgi:formate/nitrite transporter FocA (FNT family)